MIIFIDESGVHKQKNNHSSFEWSGDRVALLGLSRTEICPQRLVVVNISLNFDLVKGKTPAPPTKIPTMVEFVGWAKDEKTIKK